jgi:transcriptional regulator with XRE-family HTH domain
MLIQKLRLQRGWSQQQLAELSGLSVRTIQRIEQGQTASIESLKSLAAVFEIDFSSIHTEDTMFDPSHAQETQQALNRGVSLDEELAFRHVQDLKRFYMHLLRYVLVVSILAIVNYVSSPHVLWVQWVALWWGVAILFHAARVFMLFPFFDAKWEKKQVEKRLGRSL